jgi:outer membrane protein, multidrug efflux system
VKIAAFLFAFSYLFASCIPDTPTTPPDAMVPSAYPSAPASAKPSLAQTQWQTLYRDPVLDGLIAKALVKNYNAQLAYAAIVVAQENLNVTRSNQQPQGSLTIAAPYQAATGQRAASQPSEYFAPEASLGASYQIDLFGKLRSATAAAQAQLLATDEGRNTVIWTLVNQVASSYFQLRELDATLSLSLLAEADREQSLRLVKLRVQYGESSLQDQRQAEQALYQVTSQLPLIRQGIAQTEVALSTLAGDYPHSIARGLPLEEQIEMPAVPPTGLPSELLLRRPDIRQAEDTLVAADAQIDVARKLLFPSLSLGVSAGVQEQLTNGLFPNLPQSIVQNGVFKGPTGLFAVLPQLMQTIFSGGGLQARVHMAKAQQQQAALAYLQTIQSAFGQVSNAIIAYDEQRAYRVQEELNAAASLDSTRLAKLRYDEGEASYLEVLDAETRSYQAELGAAQARLDERLAIIQLYSALGGGWSSE